MFRMKPLNHEGTKITKHRSTTGQCFVNFVPSWFIFFKSCARIVCYGARGRDFACSIIPTIKFRIIARDQFGV